MLLDPTAPWPTDGILYWLRLVIADHIPACPDVLLADPLSAVSASLFIFVVLAFVVSLLGQPFTYNCPGTPQGIQTQFQTCRNGPGRSSIRGNMTLRIHFSYTRDLRTLGEVTRGGSQAGCVNLRAVHDRSCDSLGGWEILGEVPNEEGVTFVTWARRRRRKKSETCIFPPSTQIRWQTHHSAP